MKKLPKKLHRLEIFKQGGQGYVADDDQRSGDGVPSDLRLDTLEQGVFPKVQCVSSQSATERTKVHLEGFFIDREIGFLEKLVEVTDNRLVRLFCAFGESLLATTTG